VVELGHVRLTSTSWTKLLPGLNALFQDSEYLKNIVIVDTILGKGEDGFRFAEGWYLGHLVHNPREVRLGRVVSRYLLSKGEKRCPLHDDNMLETLPGDDDEVVFPGEDNEDDDDEDAEAWEQEFVGFEFVHASEQAPMDIPAMFNNPAGQAFLDALMTAPMGIAYEPEEDEWETEDEEDEDEEEDEEDEEEEEEDEDEDESDISID